MTAREDPYSSDEDEVSTVRPALPSAKTSATEVAQMPRPPQQPQRREEVGLGLGLESDNDRASTPKATKADNSQEEFGVFDGGWGGDASEVEREWDDNLMRNVTVRKRPRRSIAFPDDEVREDHIITPTMATKVVRNLSLQDRTVQHRIARDTPNRTPAENPVGKRSWLQPAPISAPPVEVESPILPDNKRFSTLSRPSVTSTVVEAMVLNAAPHRQKTLRHTRKQLGLRDFSDHSVKSSESLAPSEPRHRLRHSSAKLPDIKHRSVSNATVSTTSSGGLTRKAVLKSGAIPVVIIPERRSSSQSRTPSLRSTSSRRSKNATSLNSAPRSASLSAPLSQSSKYNEPGYFDNNATRKRTMSESAGSSRSVRTIDYPPSIPIRRSSLSAAASRDTSRTGSLTAESLKAHNMIQSKKGEVVGPKVLGPRQPSEKTERTERTERDIGSHSHRSNVDHNGDPFFGNRLSTQVTPFSQISYETAGTMAEVSEALAVSIFPHQNKSVLVVQQRAPSDSTLPALQTGPSMTLNGKLTTGPVTPPQPIHPMDEVDSPLKNPRDPPEPPAIKFIPATPSGLTPSQEEERQLGHGLERPSLGDGKRTMSLIRRLSGRDSLDVLSQRPSFLVRTFSLGGKRRDGSTQTSKPEANVSTLYPSVADKPQDGTKLHPFWRPAHFWDDLEDEENGYDAEYGYSSVDNRPQRTFSQKLKRTFAILPIEDDHLYNSHATERRTVQRTPSEKLRVVKRRSNSSIRRGENRPPVYAQARSASGPSEGSFGYGFKEGNGGRSHVIPGLNLRVEYVGWGGLKRRLSERKREQRSEKLRQTISGPKGVQSGMDDVLRQRSRVGN